MVVIVVYSHVYGGWHAASTCNVSSASQSYTELLAGDTAVQAESIHLVPVCINAQQLHLVQYRGALGGGSSELFGKRAVPASCMAKPRRH